MALRRILSHEIYVSERIAHRMLQRYIGSPSRDRPSSIADLTDRELEVFRLIGEGHSTRQIAEKLHISVKTVETHRMALMTRLGVKDVAGLVRYAVKIGLVDPLS